MASDGRASSLNSRNAIRGVVSLTQAPPAHSRNRPGCVGVQPDKARIEGAMCQRSAWPDRRLFEMVRFHEHHDGPEELSEEELNEWIALSRGTEPDGVATDISR